MDERRKKSGQPIYQHLTNWAKFAEYLKFYALPDIDAVNIVLYKELYLHHVVTDIIDRYDNWVHLQYLETCYSKTMSPKVNIRLKASKERQLFK